MKSVRKHVCGENRNLDKKKKNWISILKKENNKRGEKEGETPTSNNCNQQYSGSFPSANKGPMNSIRVVLPSL